MRNIPLALVFLLFGNSLFSQKAIILQNPSFEDEPTSGAPPKGWTPCGMPGETPCDVQPGSYGCVLPPADGKSYLGMVTRDNFTWEGVSQKLPAPLDSSVCHTFTVQLAASQNYNSLSRLTGDQTNYNQPVVFQIWGGYQNCAEAVLLGESPVILHRDWHKYRFIMRHLQHKPLTHLTFQVHYPPGNRCWPTIGNLLVDDVSAITETDCPTNLVSLSSEEPVANMPVLTSEAQLDKFLYRELSAVRYQSKSDVRFEYQCEEGTQGRAVFNGVHLDRVAAAMRQFPDNVLVLRVKNAKAKTLKKRAAFLREYLLATGLPENQFEVKPFDKNELFKSELETEWLIARW